MKDINSKLPGDKVKFTGIKPFWFTDIVGHAKRNLERGKLYTIKTKKSLSSWTKITLEETGDLEFNLVWFE